MTPSTTSLRGVKRRSNLGAQESATVLMNWNAKHGYLSKSPDHFAASGLPLVEGITSIVSHGVGPGIDVERVPGCVGIGPCLVITAATVQNVARAR